MDDHLAPALRSATVAAEGGRLMEWSVDVEAAHPGGQSVDQDAAEDLVELLGPYHVGGVAFSPGHYGCRFDVHAERPV